LRKTLTTILITVMLLSIPFVASAATRQEEVASFMLNYGDFFSPENTDNAKKHLSGLSTTAFKSAIDAKYRDPDTMLLVAIFLGTLGVDRFMLGDTTMGILKLVTGGGLGIWTVIDCFSIEDRTWAYNYDLLMSFK
jgi:hypothetical protein